MAYDSDYRAELMLEGLRCRSGLPRALVPNLLLAVMWASQANTIPATFWTVAFLLMPENNRHLDKVLFDMSTYMQKGNNSCVVHSATCHTTVSAMWSCYHVTSAFMTSLKKSAVLR